MLKDFWGYFSFQVRTVNSLTNVLGSIGYYVLEQASSLVSCVFHTDYRWAKYQSCTCLERYTPTERAEALIVGTKECG